MTRKIALVISCEHAVDTVPKPYLPLFIPFKSLLKSHRGIDFGALTLAKTIKNKFSCNFIQANTTRLLIDCNRSLDKPECFSEVTQNLSTAEKNKIISNYYTPFRQQVKAYIEKHQQQKSQVWHLSIHSFTPVLNNSIRTTDIGLLYDPTRRAEKNLSHQWKNILQKQDSSYIVKMNYPYKGTSDGLTSYLRTLFIPENYLGIELEVNQKLTQNKTQFANLKKIITNSLSILYTDYTQ